jgi:restriction system protein
MKTKKMWMVRAGESAKWIEDFAEHKVVAIGWADLGLIAVGESREEITERAAQQWPNQSKSKIASGVGQVFRFLNEIKKGDGVVSYDPGRRVYLVGVIEGEPEYKPELFENLPRVRAVAWKDEVPRDKLSVPTRNTLGSISTLFQLSPEAAEEILKVQAGGGLDQANDPVGEDEVADELARDLRARSLEFIKDQISSLNWEEMQELVAGLLRAMGYKTRISPAGADRGKDIIASPDGFGFEQPRIVVEVKHRPNTAMGSQELRSFLGGRHKDDKGLYVSTGGFTKDAKYEADRGSIPVILLDLDDLSNEIIRHYDEIGYGSAEPDSVDKDLLADIKAGGPGRVAPGFRCDQGGRRWQDEDNPLLTI